MITREHLWVWLQPDQPEGKFGLDTNAKTKDGISFDMEPDNEFPNVEFVSALYG